MALEIMGKIVPLNGQPQLAENHRQEMCPLFQVYQFRSHSDRLGVYQPPRKVQHLKSLEPIPAIHLLFSFWPVLIATCRVSSTYWQQYNWTFFIFTSDLSFVQELLDYSRISNLVRSHVRLILSHHAPNGPISERLAEFATSRDDPIDDV